MRNGKHKPTKTTTEDPLPGVKYSLEIMMPGSGYTPAFSFEAVGPFLAIQKGDLLNPRAWVAPKHETPESLHDKVLVVESVEHMLWHVGDVLTHKIVAHTRAIPDRQEARTPKRKKK